QTISPRPPTAAPRIHRGLGLTLGRAAGLDLQGDVVRRPSSRIVSGRRAVHTMIRSVAAVAALCAVATACSDASPQRMALATATTRPPPPLQPATPQSPA